MAIWLLMFYRRERWRESGVAGQLLQRISSIIITHNCVKDGGHISLLFIIMMLPSRVPPQEEQRARYGWRMWLRVFALYVDAA